MYRRKQHNAAQLMIVTAFILAITFLLLATLLNLVIYAENKAARGLTVAKQSSYEAHTQTDHALTGLLNKTNQQVTGNDYSKITSQYRNGTEVIFDVQKIRQAKQQKLVKSKLISLNTGTRLIQDTDRDFTSANGNPGWRLVQDSAGTRNMSQEVIRSDLYHHTNSSETVDPLFLSVQPVFETQFVNSSGTWRVYLMTKDYTNEIVLYVVNPSGGSEGSCAVTQSRATVDYSKQTLGGQSCTALSFLDTLGEHDIQYQYANNVRGQYHVHTTEDISQFSSGNFNTASSATAPYKSASIYSVTYKIAFVSKNVDYYGERTIKPEVITND